MMDRTLRSLSGRALAATQFGSTGRARVVLAGATGVPRRHYRAFAEHLERAGFDVITFDYTGIGDSKQGSLAECDASFLSWAEDDLAGVVRWSLETKPTAVVGHSFGGHAFGLLPMANQTLGLYGFGVGAGWHGYMPLLERPKVLTFFNVFGPAAIAALGYCPSSRIGLGEDLPRDVFNQWRRWCAWPNYFFDDPELDVERRFETVRVPVVGVTSTDDLWAPPRSAEALLTGYSEAPLELRTFTPASPVGHLGYFRRGAEQTRLWSEVVSWLDERAGARVGERVGS